MRYINATQVLPQNLLKEIQNYADGILLYIPRKSDCKRPWGADTSTRRDLAQRNGAIYEEYRSGVAVQTLSEQYFLSEKNDPQDHHTTTHRTKGATYVHRNRTADHYGI